jgi:hypothetical protein
MIVADFIVIPQFKLLTSTYSSNQLVSGLFASDLLSFVMGNIKEHNVLLTIIANFNVLAVAHLMKIPCIIFTSNVIPKPELIIKAEEENIAIITTPLDTAKAIKVIYETLSI